MNQFTVKFLTSLLAFLLITTFSACDKETNTEPEPESEKITLSVNAIPYDAYLVQSIDIGFGLNVVGSFEGGKNIISLLLDTDITVGTHDLSDLNSNYRVFWDVFISTTNIERYISESGSFVIEEYNKETGVIKGTFNAKCTTTDNKSVNITNGVFVAFE